MEASSLILSVTCTYHDLYDTSSIHITYITNVYYDKVFDLVLNCNINTLHGMFTLILQNLFYSFVWHFVIVDGICNIMHAVYGILFLRDVALAIYVLLLMLFNV